eukprot:scaffold6209_cov35-Attheya_sp.AAC.1
MTPRHRMNMLYTWLNSTLQMLSVGVLKDVRMGSKGYESIYISFSTNHVDFYVFFSTTEARRSLWRLRPMSVVSTDNKVVSTVLA